MRRQEVECGQAELGENPGGGAEAGPEHGRPPHRLGQHPPGLTAGPHWLSHGAGSSRYEACGALSSSSVLPPSMNWAVLVWGGM